MRSPTSLVQAAAAGRVLARIVRDRQRREPLSARILPRGVRVSVIVPARDEAGRLGGLLEALAADGDAWEVVVVDDRSTDGTFAVAAGHGVRAVPGAQLPAGWARRPWTLQQGLEAARGDVVVALDAGVRPRPGLLAALVCELEGADWVTVSPRVACPTAAGRLLRATLVRRLGPPGGSGERATAVRRASFLAAGGYAIARDQASAELALVQALRDRGWRVARRDGSALLDAEPPAAPLEAGAAGEDGRSPASG